MPVETTLTPINGAEIKKILKHLMEQRIDKIPMLKEGETYKQVTVGFELILTAFPADRPVPTAEWEILIGLEDGEDLVFDKDKQKLKELKDKRNILTESIARIDKFLSKHGPTEVIKEIESDNGTPDELRERANLKIPVVKTSTSGAKSEIMMGASQLRNNNVAKKG